MNKYQRLLLIPICLLAFSLACTMETLSTSTPTTPALTISIIKENPGAYAGQLVSLRGYGVVVMSLPLCPGHVGMDTRKQFIDEQQNDIPAVVTASAPGAEKSDTLRLFLGTVKIFSGEMGCPGSIGNVIFPYFEITEIR
jgi:hypothetical protein